MPPRMYLEEATGRGGREGKVAAIRAPLVDDGTSAGVRATPPSYRAAFSGDDKRGTAAAEAHLDGAALPHRSTHDSQCHLLLWRHGNGPDRSIHCAAGPGGGDKEMSPVHVITHAGRLVGKPLTEWLVASIDTDQWMIVLLTMSCGICLRALR